jgi:hypothetical protein
MPLDGIRLERRTNADRNRCHHATRDVVDLWSARPGVSQLRALLVGGDLVGRRGRSKAGTGVARDRRMRRGRC